MACRNSIIEFYKQFKNVETFADIVNLLKTEVKMPNVAGSFGNDDCSLHNQCMRLGYQFANYYVQYHAIRQGRPLATVSTNEIIAQGESWGRRFFILLQSGCIKPLYLITAEASDFINATALTEGLDEQFFQEHLARPLILYSDMAHPLFDDAVGILVYYNQEEKSLDCRVSFKNSLGQGGEVGRVFSLDELRVLKEKVVLDDADTSQGVMFSQGGIAMDDMTCKLSSAMLYAFKFKLLSLCAKTQIVIARQFKRRNNPRKDKQLFGTLNYQRVSLTESCRYAIQRQKNADETITLDKEGKERRVIRVRGFLRRQHYGPENSQVKFVYIEEHDSHSWIRVGLRIIKVKR